METKTDKPTVPESVWREYRLEPGSITWVGGGHINLTYTARSVEGARCVLQRVNPIFPAAVNFDFDAVTRHLRARGQQCPTLVRTTSGALWVEHDDGCWRAQSFIEGESTESVRSAVEAREAGRLLGRFHASLASLKHEFRSVRADAHDTASHLAALERALVEHGRHGAVEAVRPVAAAILEAASRIKALPQKPLRVVHGDPKISNVLFDPQTRTAVCLIDLDTVGRHPIASELGDALRSWCNPAGEDAPGAGLSTELFTAAIAGYAAGGRGLLTPQEIAAIPAATYAIAVELAARFCADALNERFFRWDPSRFASAAEHNLARARAQLSVAQAAAAAEPMLTDAIADAFDAAPDRDATAGNDGR